MSGELAGRRRVEARSIGGAAVEFVEGEGAESFFELIPLFFGGDHPSGEFAEALVNGGTSPITKLAYLFGVAFLEGFPVKLYPFVGHLELTLRVRWHSEDGE